MPLASGSRGRHWCTPIPSVPRNASKSSVSFGFPALQEPTADSLSHTSSRGTAPACCSSAQCPPIRSGLCLEQIIIAKILREYPATITSTGGRPTCPCPSGTSTGGNHRSHCIRCPGRYVVRDDGSGGRNSGRSTRTRSLSTVNDRSHPTRSAITVAGILGVTRSSSRIAGSNTSTDDPLGGRSYRGGRSLANALFTVFRATPSWRAITAIGTPSARCSRRISAQSSTLITLHRVTAGGQFSPVDSDQDSPVVDTSALDCLRTYAGESSEWFTRAQQFYANNGDRQSFESGVRSVGDVLRLWVSDVRAGVAPIRLVAVEGARVVATTDVMSQVRSLLADKSVHPAAPIVLAGGALETALKGIVLESELEVRGNGSILAYAKALREDNLISKQEMKDIEQMAGLRNDAAHGNFEELSRERAGLMEQQVNFLLSRLAERFDGS